MVIPDEREHSADGHELMFANHVLAPFTLTAALQELLGQSAPARVINLSSGGMYDQARAGDDLQSENTKYGPRTPEQGTDTIVWLGGDPEPLASAGLFWHDRRPRPTHYLIGASEDSQEDRRCLWELCKSLVDQVSNAGNEHPYLAA